MLKQEILNNWRADIPGHAQSLASLSGTSCEAWTMRYERQYGVAIPYEGTEIHEHFAGAQIKNMAFLPTEGKKQPVLVLLAESDEIKDAFALLCEDFIAPGKNGSHRQRIGEDPLAWWQEWKQLLGNRNIDERIYDVLGELCVLRYEVENHREAVWNGPEGASYDIEEDELFLEVKSSIHRDRREATISSQFQLFPQQKPLALILCCFEPSVATGECIDGVIADFQRIGYNVELLESKLERLGFEKGMSARKKKFILHEMLQYEIDETFPRITPDSFQGGVMPDGITKITYTVDLSGRTPKSLRQGDA